MLLREISMYLMGSWKDQDIEEKYLKDVRLLSTRCVCTLVERLLGKTVHTADTQKINLMWVPKVRNDRIITYHLGITEKQIEYDYKLYCSMSDDAKKKETIRLIREYVGDIFLKKGWDYTALMEACDEAERLGLHNQWIAKKPKNNKSRSVTAEIEVVHEIDTFTINVVFRNKKTGEEERIMLYETDRPDDYLCYDYLGKFMWTNNEEIELHHKWTGKVMRAKCSIV